MAKRKDGKPNSPKISQAEKDIRVLEVIKMLWKGCSKHSIIAYGVLNWGITDSTVKGIYLKTANKIMREDNTQEVGANRALAVSRFEFLYKKAVVKDDIPTAKSIIAEMGKMLGLYASKKIDMNATIQDANVFAKLADAVDDIDELEKRE